MNRGKTSTTARAKGRSWYLNPLLLLLVLLGVLAGAGSEVRAEAFLTPIGGSGGSQYITPCPAGQNLTGFELHAGLDIDAIRPVCVISLGPSTISVPPVNAKWAGGPGGRQAWVVCPASTPIVLGIDVTSEGTRTITVNNIHLFCGQAVSAAQTPAAQPSAIFDAPDAVEEDMTFFGGVPDSVKRYGSSQRCPPGQVAVGVHGKSGVWLDSMGLICDMPRMTAAQTGDPVKALGRVPKTSTPLPPRPICDVAKEARARNSPAAPGLEAQCQASKTVKALGRVEAPFTAPPRPICDVAKEARARNSPAAPGLEAQCRAELATRGEAIANQDPLSAELRSRARNDLSRRGFDLGMAVAEGQTMPGPGKQAIHDAIKGVEQAGFDAAVSFSLQRNRNAQLAATGAAIARADPAVAQARSADSDVFYWLGFDIATGIFGDPALGASGNTATGPGSLGIRDALNPAAQRGFNASVALHLSRSYKRAPAIGSNAPAPNAPVLSAAGLRSAVVISQVYGGGGTVDAAIASDFVEILNRGAEPVDVGGWSIQYASSSGATWQVTPLTGTIAPGHYFLIQEGSSSASANALPAPDLAGRIMMAANAGKVALIRNSTAISGFCPAGPDLVDFIGYGNVNCAEGGALMPELGRATSAIRNGAGCIDSDRNAADFQVATPQPRNQVSKPVSCQP